MPWTAEDAKKKTHKANTAKKRRQWAHVANSAKASGDSDASSIKQANAVVARSGGKKPTIKTDHGRDRSD